MKAPILPLPRVWLATLCLAAISLPGSLAAAPDTEADAYAAISALKPKKGDAELARLAPAFLKKYPDSPHYEKVAGLTAEALLRKKDWKSAQDLYLRLAERFPQSTDLDRYKFQTAVCRLELKEYEPAALLFGKFLKDYPESNFKEEAAYRLALANYFQNKYKETLQSCRAYLSEYPEGQFAGLILYRLALVDFHDTEVDQSQSIITHVGDFIAKHPKDAAFGPMHCLLGDTWLKRKPTNPADAAATAKEIRANEGEALKHYRAVLASPASEDESAEHAFKAAGKLLTKRGEKEALRELQAEYQKRIDTRLKEAQVEVER